MHNNANQPIALRPARARRTYRGGANIERWHSAPNPAISERPEEWVCSVTEAVNAGFGKIEGEGLSFLVSDRAMSLRGLIHTDPEAFLGRRHLEAYGENLAVLVKLIDSAQRLSIQVHPDRMFAKKFLKSDFGKTEAWYILEARPAGGEDPYLLIGFKDGVTRERWTALFEEQDVSGMVNSLNRIKPEPGQVYLIEGGMPHAIGPGCFLIEIQEPTDYTFRTERVTVDGKRLDDALIHQGLGFERVMDCFHYDDTGEQAVAKTLIKPKMANQTAGGDEVILIGKTDTNYFSMVELQVNSEMECTNGGSFSSIITLSGEGAIEWDGGSVDLKTADQMFLPYGLKRFSLVKKGGAALRIIRCFPPLI